MRSLLLPSSKSSDVPVSSVRAPTVSVPGVTTLPAVTWAPLWAVTAPLIVPLPLRVAPPATVTADAASRLPSTCRPPALITVAPV